MAFVLIAASLALHGIGAHAAQVATNSDLQWNVEQLDKILAADPSAEVQIDDMVFTRATIIEHRDRLAAQADGGVSPNAVSAGGTNFWSGGVVYYRFDASVSTFHREQFIDAASEWSAFANIQFIVRSAQPNYVTVKDQPGLDGGNSAVGMIGGEQFLNIGSAAWNRFTILHEVGHALGFVHEHQRSDRDTYLTVLTANIQPGAEPNFVLLPGSTNYAAYDFLSTMHYSRTAFSVDPATKNTLEPKPGFQQFLDEMGNQFDRPQSRFDRAGIGAIYGPPVAAPSGTVVNTKDSGPGSLRTAISYAFDRAATTPGTVTTVQFHIPATDPNFDGTVAKVRPTAVLPALGDRTMIDGDTQTAFGGNTNAAGPEVLISGAKIVSPAEYASGFVFRGSSSTVRGVVVNGFNLEGVRLVGAGATGNVLSGSYIGTDPSGTAPSSNAYSGVVLTGGAHGNTVGGGNVISGNTDHGIVIEGAGTDSNVVQGNKVGLNAAGSAAMPNGFSGVVVFAGAQSNRIGGSAAGQGNTLSGNHGAGLTIASPGTDENVVEGNLIGTNSAGGSSIPNEDSGVAVYGGAQSNTIGGTSGGARNVISGNSKTGIFLSQTATSSNLVAGNYIGLTANGAGVLANGWEGVQISGGASNNTIGGIAASLRNVIGGNNGAGITLFSAGTTGNQIFGNTIGQNALGGAAGNDGGIVLSDGVTGNQIGGTDPGSGNIITNSSWSGVALFDSTTTANTVSGNAVFANAGLGIDLVGGVETGGVTANDAGDGDAGPNGLQNYPVVVSATTGAQTTIRTTFDGAPNTTVRIEVFSSPSADPSGYGEAAVYLDSSTLSTNGSGHAAADFVFQPANVPVGNVVTATATDAAGNTSELARAVRVIPRMTTGDYDGTGTTDIAIYRPSNGVWFVRGGSTVGWGLSGDIPVPGDYNGNATTDVAVYRPSNGAWFVNGGTSVSWGIGGDVPVPGDYNGDGTTDVAVYRPSNGVWFVRGGATVGWGIAGDIPVPGDYNGDGTTDIAVYRPSNGGWFVNGGAAVSWGIGGDIPVPGDYNGDGTTDIAVYRPSNGVWFVRGGATVGWGIGGDVPQPGDFNGDGRTELAVYRPSNGGWFINGGAAVSWGIGGDVPLTLPDAIRRRFFAPL